MSKRIALVALAALCAVALSAIAASGASAAETTAYTCVAQAGGKFENSHCNTAKPSDGGTYEHVAITTNTQLTLSAIGNQTLSSTIAGAAVTLSGTGLECVNCMAENTGGVGTMGVTGSGGTLKYTGVEVVGKSTTCEVPSGTITTKPLKFETTGTAEAKISPESGTVLAEFEIKSKTGQTCKSLPGTYKVSGTVGGTAAGSTLTVNAATTSLTLGVNPATLAGEATIKAGTTGSEVMNPAALT